MNNFEKTVTNLNAGWTNGVVIQASLLPGAANVYDVGSIAYRWRIMYSTLNYHASPGGAHMEVGYDEGRESFVSKVVTSSGGNTNKLEIGTSAYPTSWVILPTASALNPSNNVITSNSDIFVSNYIEAPIVNVMGIGTADQLRVTRTTAAASATDTTDAALQVAGGIAVVKNVKIGTTLDVVGAATVGSTLGVTGALSSNSLSTTTSISSGSTITSVGNVTAGGNIFCTGGVAVTQGVTVDGASGVSAIGNISTSAGNVSGVNVTASNTVQGTALVKAGATGGISLSAGATLPGAINWYDSSGLVRSKIEYPETYKTKWTFGESEYLELLFNEVGYFVFYQNFMGVNCNDPNATLDVDGTFIIRDGTESTSSTTGCFKAAGGIGVAKSAFIGLALDVGTNATVGGNATVEGRLRFANEPLCDTDGAFPAIADNVTYTAADVLGGYIVRNNLGAVASTDTLPTASALAAVLTNVGKDYSKFSFIVAKEIGASSGSEDISFAAGTDGTIVGGVLATNSFVNITVVLDIANVTYVAYVK